LKYSTVLVCFMYDYDVAEMFCSFTSFQWCMQIICYTSYSLLVAAWANVSFSSN
jgi:hypothetical protein